MMLSPASAHLLPSAAAVPLLPRRASLQLSCATGWRSRSRRPAVVGAATAEAATPAYTSDSLILYFKAEGTMEERAIPKITETLQGMEGVKDLEVLIEEGIGSVVVRQLFLATLVQNSMQLPVGTINKGDNSTSYWSRLKPSGSHPRSWVQAANTKPKLR
ncbi:unnamed protein product [Urochloa decumbens]|uniref:Uncharacterized protein n=1 Tax=Urochloa decumbens TaxID=240449 RepID=A0ABC8VKX9_9POAL